MKQKYMILKSNDNKHLIIKEFAEIEKDMFSLLCEETYEIKTIQSAIKSGMSKLISTIRTQTFYPSATWAKQIAEGIVNCFNSKSSETVEIFVDDAEALQKKEDAIEIIDDLENGATQIDGLLDDTVDVYDENITPKKINSSINVEENELPDDDNDDDNKV